MSRFISRRGLVLGSIAAAIPSSPLLARQSSVAGAWSLPIRIPGDIPGDGFLIRHGFTTENTWFQPGLWHTGEDWYRADNVDTAGAEVLAVTAGEVRWIGSDYPGRVIFVQHDSGLYSMYGHVEFDVQVAEGYAVEAGDVLGRVLSASEWRAPNHLHFEMRDFFFNPVVNGDSPKYEWACGFQCPPGPGYWPIDDPQHPAELGWRNPAHLIHRGFGSAAPFEAQVATGAGGLETSLRAAPDANATVVEEVVLERGDQVVVDEVMTGDPETTETSALAYQVWYRVTLNSGANGWLPALEADDNDTGSDGRPSSVRPVVLPVPTAVAGSTASDVHGRVSFLSPIASADASELAPTSARQAALVAAYGHTFCETL